MRRYIGRIRRRWLMLRFRNLNIGYGTTILGRFRLKGQGNVHIGNNCRLVSVRIRCDGELVVGDRCFMNKTVVVATHAVSIGEDCLLSDAYIVDTDFHNVRPEERNAALSPKATRPVNIENNVWVGDGCGILKGSRIGENSVVGSFSVVRGVIPSNAVAFGNPARVVKLFDRRDSDSNDV